jgi:hypothetical protein
MFHGLQKNIRKKRKVITIISLVIVLLIGFLYFYEPATPDGVYFDGKNARLPWFYILKEGKVSIKCNDEIIEEGGAYYKLANKWIWGNYPTNTAVIKPSLFGIKLTGSQFPNGQAFLLRDCFFGTVVYGESIRQRFFP